MKKPMHPGKILKKITDELHCGWIATGISPLEAIYNMTYIPEVDLENLLNAEIDVDYLLAYKLGANIRGTDMAFWLKLQKDYDDYMERMREDVCEIFGIPKEYCKDRPQKLNKHFEEYVESCIKESIEKDISESISQLNEEGSANGEFDRVFGEAHFKEEGEKCEELPIGDLDDLRDKNEKLTSFIQRLCYLLPYVQGRENAGSIDEISFNKLSNLCDDMLDSLDEFEDCDGTAYSNFQKTIFEIKERALKLLRMPEKDYGYCAVHKNTLDDILENILELDDDEHMRIKAEIKRIYEVHKWEWEH